MQVNKISNTTFESNTPKKRFITNSMRSSIENLLFRMNSDIKKVQDGDHYRTTINTKVNYHNDKASFEDERRLKTKVPYNEQMQGFSVLRIGKNTVLDIENETGEIIDYKKSRFKPFFLVLRKAESVLLNIRTNFNLTEVVKKEYLTLNDLTPEGLKNVRRLVLKCEKERLEKVINNFEETSK